MIGIKDLRIGNLVKVNGTTVLVDSVHRNGIRVVDVEDKFPIPYELDFTAIPLTEEILLKCGFKVEYKKGSHTNFRVYRLVEFTYNTNHGWWFHNHLAHEPKHLHQLQNLYFSLTGKELEVKL